MLELRAPKRGTKCVVHHDRLALFHDTREAKRYWSQYWLSDQAIKQLDLATSGTLDPGFDAVLRMLEQYGSPGMRILEGGCGLGHVVAALQHRGYRAFGVDYVPELIAFATERLPGLDLRVGDVEELPFEDGAFDCYASLGVIEHFEQGPEKAIADGQRIVRPGGIAIFEVPYLNALRERELARLRRHAAGHDGLAFHQYYYSIEELTGLFENYGFTVVEQVPNCWESVVFREHPIVAPFWSSRLAISRVRDPIRTVVRGLPAIAQRRYAHTMVFACRRDA